MKQTKEIGRFLWKGTFSKELQSIRNFTRNRDGKEAEFELLEWGIEQRMKIFHDYINKDIAKLFDEELKDLRGRPRL